MDMLSFIASLVDSLVWPFAVLAISLSFKGPLIDLIADLRSFRLNGFEASFARGLESAKEEMESAPVQSLPAELPRHMKADPLPKTERELIERFAELSPNVAVMESWRGVERAIELYCDHHGLSRPISGQSFMRHLSSDKTFPPQLVAAYQELRLLRNRAAHERGVITKKNAMEFSALAERLSMSLVVSALR